jgi:hypothetical protein
MHARLRGRLCLKISMNVDCTPEEARSFFGLPDLRPMQDAMLAQMQAQIQKTAAGLDPETIFKTLFPQSESLGEMQKAFWSQFNTPDPKR